ncbi:sensor domain-containing diguanylate cyclase [Comamonas flocculans]|uniref:Diguanylate cyclase n=1 Tax=Comamonas flocculans TaxID=2597701 RepID=A0A5B8RT96_9BURK|nr:sensor domain-containing diguanylate cyclase [Comamonas flocculans]QEA12333.1 diguanylate cyclase [Comamonas flocculans]
MPERQRPPAAPAHGTPPTARPRQRTLRLSLILPFVSLIALLTGGLGVMWYWSGSRTATDLSRHLMQEMVERMVQAVGAHLHNSGAMLQAVYPEGLAAGPDIREDLASLRTRLWAATSLSGRMGDYVHYGNVAGQNIGLLRLTPTQAELRMKTRAQEPRTYYRLDGIDARARAVSTEATVFDPRTRPWFKAARQAATDVWTPVYIDFNARDLVMTRARRVPGPDGQAQGVVATDLFLNALQRFVDELPMVPGGQAMLLEPDGAVIAISGAANMRPGSDGRPERVHAAGSANTLLRESHAALRDAVSQGAAGRRANLVIEAGGDKVQVAWQRITDSAGLNWLAVVALPHKDMLAGVRRDLLLLGALGLLVLGFALAIGLHIFGGVARDMRTLTHAMRRMGAGDMDAPIRLQRGDEIGELARNFRAMRQSLFTDPLTGVSNRGALNHLLARLTQESAVDGQLVPFALVFIDLNRFKPLNDRWGHDNGDRALREIAQRLRAQLRAGDALARLGGDEFVVVAQGVGDDDQALQLMEALRLAIGAPLRTLKGEAAGRTLSVGAAIGHALFPRDGENPSDLLRCADEAMYRDKPVDEER